MKTTANTIRKEGGPHSHDEMCARADSVCPNIDVVSSDDNWIAMAISISAYNDKNAIWVRNKSCHKNSLSH